MSDVTQILSRIDSGDPSAAAQLLPLVYEELRRLAAAKLAHEKPGQTLQATALVHDAYLRLVGDDGGPQWNGRGHFFAAAAEAMRRILVESARRKKRLKRGGDAARIELSEADVALPEPNIDVLALDTALSRLAEEQPDNARLVELRFFAGLTLDQAASAMGISTATAVRKWRYSRAWLTVQLGGESASNP